MSLEPKKLALLRILQILKEYSDYDHPLTQERILHYLYRDYGIELERKAVGKNIELLRDAGYDIISDRRGTYLAEREFEESELRMLIDSVLYARHITPTYAKKLIENLAELGSISFQKKLKTGYITERLHDAKFSDFFYNIEVLQEAIDHERKVSFVLNRYEQDKQLHPVSDAPIIVNPYRLVNLKGKYYLLGNMDEDCGIVGYRIEFISDLQIRDELRKHITETELGKYTIDEFISGHPDMYAGNMINAKMRVARYLFPDLIDEFGKNFSVGPVKDERLSKWYVEVGIYAGSWELFHFALEHLGAVEVLSPESLRERIKRYVKDGYKDYFPEEK